MRAIVLISLILISCGPASKLRRAERLIAKAEKQGLEWHSDTLYTTVEIPIPEVKTDTVFESLEGDTVLIQKDRLEIRYVNLPGEKVYIEGTCLPDTVYKEVPTVINKEINCPPNKTPWPLILITVIMLLLAVIKIFK